MIKTSLKNKDGPRGNKLRHITSEDVKMLVTKARAGIKDKKAGRRREEPGLTEEARYFIVKF
jgi:hypothetical protein